MTRPPSAERVTAAFIAWVETRLSDRDQRVLEAVANLRLVSGQQLDALCFLQLHGRSRSVVRGRVVARLVSWRVLQLVDRRIGGPQPGSGGAIYSLDVVGHALRGAKTITLAGVPGERFRAHTLAISQLCADLALLLHDDPGVTLHEYVTEPDSWWPDGLGGYLKPDAYLQLRTGGSALHAWAEIDRSSESIPTMTRKLRSYLDFIERGHLGPSGLVPQVLITVIDERRERAVRELIGRLPPPAGELFLVARDRAAARLMLGLLRE